MTLWCDDVVQAACSMWRCGASRAFSVAIQFQHNHHVHMIQTQHRTDFMLIELERNRWTCRCIAEFDVDVVSSVNHQQRVGLFQYCWLTDIHLNYWTMGSCSGAGKTVSWYHQCLLLQFCFLRSICYKTVANSAVQMLYSNDKSVRRRDPAKCVLC